MRGADAIPDAPVYSASLSEMDDLEELLASASRLALQHGAVRIDPPPDWVRPPLRMARDSRFFVRMQTLPAAPFVDTTPPEQPERGDAPDSDAPNGAKRRRGRARGSGVNRIGNDDNYDEHEEEYEDDSDDDDDDPANDASFVPPRQQSHRTGPPRSQRGAASSRRREHQVSSPLKIDLTIDDDPTPAPDDVQKHSQGVQAVEQRLPAHPVAVVPHGQTQACGGTTMHVPKKHSERADAAESRTGNAAQPHLNQDVQMLDRANAHAIPAHVNTSPLYGGHLEETQKDGANRPDVVMSTSGVGVSSACTKSMAERGTALKPPPSAAADQKPLRVDQVSAAKVPARIPDARPLHAPDSVSTPQRVPVRPMGPPLLRSKLPSSVPYRTGRPLSIPIAPSAAPAATPLAAEQKATSLVPIGVAVGMPAVSQPGVIPSALQTPPKMFPTHQVAVPQRQAGALLRQVPARVPPPGYVQGGVHQGQTATLPPRCMEGEGQGTSTGQKVRGLDVGSQLPRMAQFPAVPLNPAVEPTSVGEAIAQSTSALLSTPRQGVAMRSGLQVALSPHSLESRPLPMATVGSALPRPSQQGAVYNSVQDTKMYDSLPRLPGNDKTEMLRILSPPTLFRPMQASPYEPGAKPIQPHGVQGNVVNSRGALALPHGSYPVQDEASIVHTGLNPQPMHTLQAAPCLQHESTMADHEAMSRRPAIVANFGNMSHSSASPAHRIPSIVHAAGFELTECSQSRLTTSGARRGPVASGEQGRGSLDAILNHDASGQNVSPPLKVGWGYQTPHLVPRKGPCEVDAICQPTDKVGTGGSETFGVAPTHSATGNQSDPQPFSSHNVCEPRALLAEGTVKGNGVVQDTACELEAERHDVPMVPAPGVPDTRRGDDVKCSSSGALPTSRLAESDTTADVGGGLAALPDRGEFTLQSKLSVVTVLKHSLQSPLGQHPPSSNVSARATQDQSLGDTVKVVNGDSPGSEDTKLTGSDRGRSEMVHLRSSAPPAPPVFCPTKPQIADEMKNIMAKATLAGAEELCKATESAVEAIQQEASMVDVKDSRPADVNMGETGKVPETILQNSNSGAAQIVPQCAGMDEEGKPSSLHPVGEPVAASNKVRGAVCQVVEQARAQDEQGASGDLKRSGEDRAPNEADNTNGAQASRAVCSQAEVIDLADVKAELVGSSQGENTKVAPPQPGQGAEDANDARPTAKPKAKKTKTGRPRNRRRGSHVSNMVWHQDAKGRLTEPIMFPDSPSPLTLGDYEKKASSRKEELRNSLAGDKSLNLTEARISENSGSEDWMTNVDILEEVFWKLLRRGIDGKPLKVSYGVDVEAEGAFDSAGQSYVEWYGTDEKTGRIVKKERPKKIYPSEPMKTESRLDVENGGYQALKDTKQFTRKDDAARLLGTGPRGDTHIMGATETEQILDGEDQPPSMEQTEELRRREREDLAEPGPKCHVGNLNRGGLLRHMPRMPGINHSMYYIGQLFTRFCWHVEDAFLNSVSYLHSGSAEKVWYAVPPEDAKAFESYASKKAFSDGLVERVGSGQALLMNKTTIFDPRDVRREGIRVFRVVHKPGSFVLTAPRAYHAGFNSGFNVAEAVNFANPTWFPVGREASRFAREIQKPLCVPWEYLLFHEAKAMHRTVSKRKSGEKASVSFVSNALILATELEAVMRVGEARIKEYASKKNCRIAMLSEIDALVKNNQLGPEFGHGAGMVCSLCGHACHFYAEICGSCDNNIEARCEKHFGAGYSVCNIPGHNTVLVRRHDPVLLADVVCALEQVAGIKRSAEDLLERYRGFVRPWETPARSTGLRLRMNFKEAASRLPPNVSVQKSAKDGHRREKRKRSYRKKSESRRHDGDIDFEASRKRRKGEGAFKSARRPVMFSKTLVEGRPSGRRAKSSRKMLKAEEIVEIHIAKTPKIESSSRAAMHRGFATSSHESHEALIEVPPERPPV